MPLTPKELIDILLLEFQAITQSQWVPDKEITSSSIRLITGIGTSEALSTARRRANLLRVINNKFGFNQVAYKGLFAYFAKEKGKTFNYHQKKEIEFFLDDNDVVGLERWLQARLTKKELSIEFISQLQVKSCTDTIDMLNEEIQKDAKLSNDIYSSIFCAFVYYSFPEELVHKQFNPDCAINYKEHYFEHLKDFHPEQIHRDESLYYLVIDDALVTSFPDEATFKNCLFQFIGDSYRSLSNHCHLAVLIKSSAVVTQEVIWNLFGDIMLYSEKFINHEIKKGYFHPEKIKKQTVEGIPHLDVDTAKFEEANEGFVYKDCFVLCSDDKLKEQEYKSHDNYSILLLLEKNERDENLIPCPSCRSKDVRGNSYPILNVKSWECVNTLCNDKSAYNRGKRYSLSSLIRQEAIDDEKNQIALASIQKWRLDVVNISDFNSVLEMLVNHYTLVHDSIVVCNMTYADAYNQRGIRTTNFPKVARLDYVIRFYQMPFFKRFGVDNGSHIPVTTFDNISSLKGIEVYNGDSNHVMRQLNASSLDGAVTSPPYYNAKEYSTWSNIYVYLQDMYTNAQEIYRTLKPGSIYLYNIFDYFDNESNIVYSLMGKKRLILGAYIIYLFKKIGFKLNGNIIWFKGEIEGKRNFNNGNMSPYYQAPHNSYEHIFVFSKGQADPMVAEQLPTILKSKPVLKMIKGENTIGHSAPYPLSIPNLLTSLLPAGSKVIDPYGGTMTTALSSHLHNLASICIDYDANHCAIGLNRLTNHLRSKALTLFN